MKLEKFRKVITKDGFEILVEEYDSALSGVYDSSLDGEQEIYLHDMYDNFIDYIVVANKEDYDNYIKSIESSTLEENVEAWSSGRYTLTDTAEDMLNDIVEDMTEESKEQVEEYFKKGLSIWASETLINIVEDNKGNKKYFFMGEY